MLRQTVFLEGIEYVLLYKATGPVAKSWAWADANTLCRVATTDIEMLRDAFLSQDITSIGKSTPPRELRRLYEVLLSMGAPRELILGRLGIHEPRKCLDCKQMTTDGYAGPRCEACHEQFVRTSRLWNTLGAEVSGGSMSGSRKR